MRKCLILILGLTVVLCGCGNEPPVLDTADFNFPMPEGYTVAYIEDLNCSILRDSDCVAVGGMEVVPLTRKNLTQKSNTAILDYLQTSFHQTNDVEFIATNYNDNSFPVVVVDMRVHRDGAATMYAHYFFETDGLIYHLWLDMDLLGEGDPGDFLSAVSP